MQCSFGVSIFILGVGWGTVANGTPPHSHDYTNPLVCAYICVGR